MLPKPQNRRVTRRAPVGSEGFPRRAPTRPQPPWFSASRARAAPAAVIFRARRFAASQSARAPRHQTRAGRFGGFPTPRAYAATAAAFFRTPLRVGRRAPVASEGLPRRAPTRPQPPCFPRHAPARPQPPRSSAPRAASQTRAGRFRRFSASRTHASTAAAFFRTPLRVGRRAPVASEGLPRRAPTRPQPPCFPRHAPARPQPPRSSAPRAASQTRAGRFRRFSASRTHASTAAAFFRTPRFVTSQSVRAPRCQTRAGRFRRFPTPCAHASTAAVFFRTPRRVADARRSVRKFSRVAYPRVHKRRVLPRPALRHIPIRESAALPDARRSVQKVSHAVRPRVHSRRVFRVTRLRVHSRRGFPRHAPARHQPL